MSAPEGAFPDRSDHLAAGWSALAAGTWDEARGAFAAALRQGESAEALEGLGWAAWWLNDAPATFDARERAYWLYREAGNDQAAGRIAIVLAADHFMRRGQPAVASGWFQRAHHLSTALRRARSRPCWASGRVTSPTSTIAIRRPPGNSASGRALASSLSALDLEILAQGTLGFAAVCEGDVAGGMRLLDEAAAAAVAGEMTDPDAIITTCCFLM